MQEEKENEVAKPVLNHIIRHLVSYEIKKENLYLNFKFSVFILWDVEKYMFLIVFIKGIIIHKLYLWTKYITPNTHMHH